MEDNKKLFNKVVGWLAEGWMKDELESGSCAACAVGNICARAASGSLVKTTWGLLYEGEELEYDWKDYFVTTVTSRFLEKGPNGGIQFETIPIQSINTMHPTCPQASQYFLKLTGLSMELLAKIEFTFESTALQEMWSRGFRSTPRCATPIPIKREAEFKGLMAVVDLLAAELLEEDDQHSPTQAKAQFQQPVLA